MQKSSMSVFERYLTVCVDFHAKLTHRGLVGHFCVEINSSR